MLEYSSFRGGLRLTGFLSVGTPPGSHSEEPRKILPRLW